MVASLRNAAFGSRIAAIATAFIVIGAATFAGVGPLSSVLGSEPTAASATTASATPAVRGIAVSSTDVGNTDVNDFVIDSFDGEYSLGVDSEGRSSLRTKEHIVAVFPDYDQNRGLIRDLVRVYDGHETELQVLSVTDEHGTPREFSTEPYGDYLSVTIAVPEGSYVHGAQHYLLEYTQRDVTREFADTGANEFYWDINGTGWAQPFGTVTAKVLLDDTAADAFTGASSCYVGGFGSNTPCEISGSGNSFSAQATDLGPEENMTLALGFEQGTFAAAPTPPVPFLERVPVLLWGGAASAIAGIATFAIALFRSRSSRTGRAIIAQYEPQEGINAATAAELLHARKKGMTATLLDFAVRRNIRLLHDEEEDRYGVESRTPDGLDPTEKWVYSRLFDGVKGAASVDSGTRVWFTKTSTKLGDAAASLAQRVTLDLKKQGLVRPVSAGTIATMIALMVLGLGLPVIHSIVLGNFVLMTVLLAVGINVLIWVILGMVTAVVKSKRLTHEGALALDHLRGLKEYIRLAEADRIRVLQSATGAEVDEQFIVGVYERLLPYAVLFGFEKEWQAELGRYYRESTPDWVTGTDPNSTNFMRTFPIASFSSSVASSPRTVTSSSTGAGSGSGSSFSSSFGGSSGGGFSGGGGGGGGGRGI